MQNYFLSCDWGTSSFRLRLVDVRDHQIFGEILSDEGVSGTYNRWKDSYNQHETSKEHFYSMHLQKNINDLARNIDVDLTDTPIVISGMACSSIGMKELPYASLPFSLDGRNAFVHRLSTSNGFSSDVWMISGVRNRYDVMRGEETQIIGLKAVDDNAYTAEDVTCIFPGTHSKHVQIVNGEVVDFKTYITGELFHVMTHHSILKDSVLANAKQMLSEIDHDAFCHGVVQSGKSNLLQTLFGVRINQLFEHLTKEENFFYLSGLLIGTELRTLQNNRNSIMLCSGSSVFQLYEFAIRELGIRDQTIFVAPERMDKVAMEGQLKVFENYTA